MNLPVPVAIDLTELSRAPAATFLWGSSRAVMKRVLYALARTNDPDPYWLDIRRPGEDAEDPDPVAEGWVKDDHLFVAREPEQARPQDALGNLALWSVVRSDEPERVRAQLSDFLRLPSIAQEIIARTGVGDGRHVVAIGNTDRVRQFYPDTPEGIRPVLAPFLAASIFPILGAVAPVGDARWAFDYVFEVRAARLSTWETGWLICEKAPADSAFRPPQAVALRSLPEIAEVLYGEEPLP